MDKRERAWNIAGVIVAFALVGWVLFSALMIGAAAW